MGIIKRQGLKSSITNYVGVALGALFFLVIFPNILDEKYLGFYSLILSVSMVFAQIPVLGTSNVLFKYFKKWNERGVVASFNTIAFLLITGATLIFSILYFVFSDIIISFYRAKSPLFNIYYYVIPPLVLFQALNHYLEHYAMMKLRVALPTFIREVFIRSLVIIILFLLAINVLSERYFVFLYVVIYALAFGALLFYSIKVLQFKFDGFKLFIKTNQDLKGQISYGSNAMGMTFITTLQNFADAIILPAYLGLGALGIYGRPMILGAMINIPYRSIAYIASPIIMEAWHNNDLKKIESLNKQLSLNLFLIGLFLFAMIVTNANNFFNILPPEYSEGKNVLYIIAFGRLLDMSFGLNSEILFSSKYYRWILWFNIITLIITIVFNIYLIPIWGMDGAAMAVTGALIVYNILKSVFIYHKFNIHCFSKKYFALISIATMTILAVLFIPDFTSLWVNSQFGSQIGSTILNTLLKSIITTILFFGPILYFKISPDFNDFIQLIRSNSIFQTREKN